MTLQQIKLIKQVADAVISAVVAEVCRVEALTEGKASQAQDGKLPMFGDDLTPKTPPQGCQTHAN